MNNLIGKRFGKLVVLERASNSESGRVRWLCKCDCKIEKVIRGDSLISGRTKSCGCLSKEKTKQRFTTHGHNKNGKPTKIYDIWHSMIQRCINPKNKAYHNYGGRGITVCEEWLHSFTNFERDNPGWEPGLTLERRKNELGYFKDNCYWGTRTEQARNKRNNHLITAFGKTQCIAAWSEETGIPAQIIQWRINHGWLPERVLTESVRKYKKYKKRRKNGRS